MYKTVKKRSSNNQTVYLSVLKDISDSHGTFPKCPFALLQSFVRMESIDWHLSVVLSLIFDLSQIVMHRSSAYWITEISKSHISYNYFYRWSHCGVDSTLTFSRFVDFRRKFIESLLLSFQYIKMECFPFCFLNLNELHLLLEFFSHCIYQVMWRIIKLLTFRQWL